MDSDNTLIDSTLIQECSILLLLNGSTENSIFKQGVTPAEIIVLRDIHGARGTGGSDPIKDVAPTGMVRRSIPAELDRLKKLYGEPSGFLEDAAESKVIDRLFPGAFPSVPVSLADIGLGHLTNAGAAPLGQTIVQAPSQGTRPKTPKRGKAPAKQPAVPGVQQFVSPEQPSDDELNDDDETNE